MNTVLCTYVYRKAVAARGVICINLVSLLLAPASEGRASNRIMASTFDIYSCTRLRYMVDDAV